MLNTSIFEIIFSREENSSTKHSFTTIRGTRGYEGIRSGVRGGTRVLDPGYEGVRGVTRVLDPNNVERELL